METRIPFRRRKRSGRHIIGRTLVIEREDSLGNVEPIGLEFDVTFWVEWSEGDNRDKRILAGNERKQNVIVDVRNVLLTLQKMFPQLEITFNEPSPLP